MSNLMNNRISTTLTTEQREAVMQAFQTIFSNLPFLLGLTVEERVSLPKINVNNKVFTQDALNEMEQNAEMLPSFMQAEPMRNDLTLYNQLDPILSMARQLVEKLEDTQMLAGSEAYISALSAYRLFGAAAAAGIGGADTVYDSLRSRFAQSNTEQNTNNTDTPQP